MRRLGALFLAVLVAVVMATSASAATITVTTMADNSLTGDNGQCTLREAITTVNTPGTTTDCGTASASGNTIVLGAHTYKVDFTHVLFIGPPAPGCVSTFVQQPDDNSSGELSVAGTVHGLTIEGAGAGQTVIDACKVADRALEVKAGATVTLRGVTIANGHARDGKSGQSSPVNAGTGGIGEHGESGGGILNQGTLTLINSAVTNSHAGDGGQGGSGGDGGGGGGSGGAGGDGGGIFNGSGASLTLTDSTVSGNAAGAGGNGGNARPGDIGVGGGSADGGSGGNGGQGGGGGGVANIGGTLTMTGTTIDHNTTGVGGVGILGQNADANGGAGGNGGDGANGGGGAGVASAGGSLHATNDTMDANTAGHGGNAGAGGDESQGLEPNGVGGNGGAGGSGGGLLAISSTPQLVNLTIAANAAGIHGNAGTAPDQPGKAGSDGIGGGVYSFFMATVSLQNTLLYENHTGGDCRGTISDAGHNLVFSLPTIGPHPTNVCDVTNFVKADPKLGPLQDNLGPTLTMALGPGSAAINQIPAGPGCPATDQRGFKRPSGAACDIGAYEVTPPALSTSPATAVTTRSATIHGTVTPFSTDATVLFQYGKTTAYGSLTSTHIEAGARPIAISAHLTGLKPNTKYHLRLTAASADGTSNSTDATFTTKALAPELSKLELKRSGRHATLHYRDSESAKTTFIVRRCSKRATHSGKCVRWVRALSFTHNDTAGANVAHFKVPRKAGHYQVLATPKAHGVKGKRVRLAFGVA